MGNSEGSAMQRRGTAEWLLLVTGGIVKTGFFISTYFCLIPMIGLMALDPILRYIVGSPFYWSNEVTTYLMILMVFNGLGITLVKGQHVRVTLLTSHLPRKIQSVLSAIVSVIGLFYVCFLVYSLILLTLDSFKFATRTITSEMLIFPWQMVGTWGLIIFFFAMIMIAARRIPIVLGFSSEEGAI
jgi:TRAP-type C4-dicarboxylate transport system permease small subunit